MIPSMDTQLQHNRRFVPANPGVKLYGQLPTDLFRAVRARLLADSQELTALALAGKVQFINAGGQFRIQGVRGGYLPVAMTSEAVKQVILRVFGEQSGVDAVLEPDKVTL